MCVDVCNEWHLERGAEGLITLRRHLGKVRYCLTSADGCDVGKLAKERVEALGLGHGSDVVGQLPEEHRNADGSPELGHDVEERVAPVADEEHHILHATCNQFVAARYAT